MTTETQIATCSEQYKRWKQLTMQANTVADIKKCLGKALFWMELQTAFMTLWNVEKTKGDDPAVKRQLIVAKTNLSRRLADYAQETWNEIEWR